jgi:hypothetical protein
VCDVGNSRIQRFTTSGAFRGKGSSGTGNGGFDLPVDVATDASGTCTADLFGDRIQKFMATGVWLAIIATAGPGPGRSIALRPPARRRGHLT